MGAEIVILPRCTLPVLLKEKTIHVCKYTHMYHVIIQSSFVGYSSAALNVMLVFPDHQSHGGEGDR